MSDEIEKKYLVKEGQIVYATPALLTLCESVEHLKWRALKEGASIRQGYLEEWKELADMVGFDYSFSPTEGRIRNKGPNYTFGVKTDGDVERQEFESPISRDIFDLFWPKTEGRRVLKVRLELPYGNYTAEIDVYPGKSELIIAEVEVPSKEEAELLVALGKDVTGDKRYKNRTLAR